MLQYCTVVNNKHTVIYVFFSATKIELYVGDVSMAVNDRLPELSQARFTRLGYVYILYIYLLNFNITVHVLL